MTTKVPRKDNSQSAEQESTDSAQTFRNLLLGLSRNPALPVPDRSPVNASESELEEFLDTSRNSEER